MELWRRADNPWGEDVLIGLSWDLMWAAVVVAAVFLIGHALWIKTRPAETQEASEGGSIPSGIPERIERHSLSARIFHLTMSVSMFALVITAFAPLMGFRFPWITVHWMAGVLLIATVVYHIIHAIVWQDFWSMFQIGFGEGMAHLKHIMSVKAPSPPKAGKYPFDHRMYHHAIVVVTLAAIVTGALMMVRIDTPFWTPNPYMLPSSVWGVMYVVHGLAGVSLIFLIASHIYFAIRPEKRWISWSMVRGWVDREHYLAHHDPEKWVVSGDDSVSSGDSGTGAVADSAVAARREHD